MESHIKLLTALRTTLLQQTIPSDVLVNLRPVYEITYSILNEGGPHRKMVLSFLTMLVRAASPEQARRARDFIRRSRCLEAMANMFLNPATMSEKILYECLAESCKESEENQCYCSRLIPACIQRSGDCNPDVLILLHSILNSNSRNVKHFVQNDGLSIFTRNSVQNSLNMELLTMIVEQYSFAANLLTHKPDLLNYLIDVEEKTKNSKIVECASVILFHVASCSDGRRGEVSKTGEKDTLDNSEGMENVEGSNEGSSRDFSVSFLLKPNWKTQNMFQYSPSRNKKSNNVHVSSRDSTNRFPFGASFKPNFASTPKSKLTANHEVKIAELAETCKRIRKQQAPKLSAGNVDKSALRDQQSMSARVFQVLNNSCSSLFKIIGNIVHQASNTGLTSKNCSNLVNRAKPSFKKYMKFRDFSTNSSEVMDMITFNKRYKMKVVKKLKHGIYLYGCNFKKIAKNMWPQENEMTPKVLYGIYRKYISRKSHLLSDKFKHSCQIDSNVKKY